MKRRIAAYFADKNPYQQSHVNSTCHALDELETHQLGTNDIAQRLAGFRSSGKANRRLQPPSKSRFRRGPVAQPRPRIPSSVLSNSLH
jgi:hypothetical protein